MSDNSRIEWTDASWNPTTGCTKVSPGCDHCYAEGMFNRFNGPGAFDTVQLRPERLEVPLHWRRSRRVFVNSMSDLFHADIPDDYIAHCFAVMATAGQHTYQVLTKRHARMRSLLNRPQFREDVAHHWFELYDKYAPRRQFCPTWADHWPLPNVWLGVSVETQQWADLRIPALLATPAAVRFLSCEPLLGPVDLTYVAQHVPPGGGPARRSALSSPCAVCHGWGGPPSCPDDYHFVSRGAIEPCIDWVIVGGESGPAARPMHPDWARTLRDQCVAAGVPYFFKQYGAHNEDGRRVGKHAAGRTLDGRTWDEYPDEELVGAAS